LPTRKVKIEFFDDHGTRHTVTIEGHVTRDKISRVLDYVELMGGASANSSNERLIEASRSKFDRIRFIVVNRFSDRVFSSKDVQEAYLQFYGEEIGLTTVSTYLSRLVDRGVLIRSGSSAEWRYAVRLASSSIHSFSFDQ
jgi:hypothetical protein